MLLLSGLLSEPLVEGGFVLTLNNISAIGMSGLSALGSVLRISLKKHPSLVQNMWRYCATKRQFQQ